MDKYNAIGTKMVGYATTGPYFCGNCIHENGGFCSHPVVVLDTEIKGERRNGKVKIDEENGCCNYVQPKTPPTKSILKTILRSAQEKK